MGAGDKLIECDLCQNDAYVTDRVDAMRKHIRDNHGGFDCARCGKHLCIKNIRAHESYHKRLDLTNSNSAVAAPRCCYCGGKRAAGVQHFCDADRLKYGYTVRVVKDHNPRRKNLIGFDSVENKISARVTREKKTLYNCVIDGNAVDISYETFNIC